MATTMPDQIDQTEMEITLIPYYIVGEIWCPGVGNMTNNWGRID